MPPPEQEHEILHALPLYVFGLLTAEERAAVDQHTAECASCRAELTALTEASAEIPQAFAGAKPHARVKDRLMQSIGKRPVTRSGAPEEVAPGIFVYREPTWHKSPFPGVEYQTMYIDPKSQMKTSMLRLAPGSRYPAHEHAGVEQSFVIEGSCMIGSYRFRRGEYAYALEGSEHEPLVSDEGCVLLVISSELDRIHV